GARITIQTGSVTSLSALPMAQRAARLRADWLARGHSPAEASQGATLALVSGNVLGSKVVVEQPGSYPALQFAFTADSTGFSSASFTFTAPQGGRTATIQYIQGVYSVRGTQSFAFPAAFPAFTAPGTWTLTAATLYDNAGNSATYDQAQLAQLFPTNNFTLVDNGPVAAYPPVLGRGRLSATSISLSSKFPQLRAAVSVSDTPTGVNQALLFLQPPGQTYSQGQITTIPFPVKSGAVEIYDDFFAGDPTGVWTITEYLVCDFAGNCTSSTSPAAIIALFGTNSITVTP
ncbi:MAG: Ig-like domain repeat protein, partial [Acidocella sp.]|nr:Ig-like domain repeat protein [Acidocella sp.]